MCTHIELLLLKWLNIHNNNNFCTVLIIIVLLNVFIRFGSQPARAKVLKRKLKLVNTSSSSMTCY